jgi:uncharacterized protein (TIGR02594 family)
MFGTKPSLGSNIVALAKDYEGLHEKSDRKSLKEVTGVDPVRTPWCAAFINALLDKQNRRGSDSHAALSFLQWGVKTREPKMGDIVVMHGHVTIFITFSDDRKSFYGIGGNQANGVKVTLYPARKVISYRTYADEFVPEYLPKKKIAPKKKYTKQPVKKRRVT